MVLATCLAVALVIVSGAWILSASGTAPRPADAAQTRAAWEADLREARADQAAADRAEARAAAQEARAAAAERKAARQAAREAARRKAARQAAAREAAAREEAARQEAAREEAAREKAAQQRTLHGTMTVPDINGALVTLVGGHPGQALSTFSLPRLNRLERLLDALESGATYACPGGSGGGFDDIAVGTQVVVEDATTGAVLATTSLTGGTLGTTGCTFDFDVEVPEAAFYRVEVSHRGEVAFSRQDLETQGWRVAMRL